MANLADIEILCCGGTIDKVYFDAKSSYQVGEPAAKDILIRARAQLPPIVSLLKKDSLDMTDEDRAAVVAAVVQSSAHRFVVCHGTDTMAQTAQEIAQAANFKDKTVVFTGAFSPAIFRETDSDFNLGFALSAALTLPAGVYIAMNAQIIPAAQARKNREAGRFESTPPK